MSSQSSEQLLSIIVPVYNVEQYLRQCLDSIIAQTYSNIEIILVNDGSLDNSGTICDKYAEKDNRIIVIHKANGGAASARNVGLDMATGDVIGFIDSDDKIDANMYEILMENMQNTDSDIVQCGLITFIGEDDNVALRYSSYKTIDNIEALQLFFTSRDINSGVCNKVFKSDLIKNMRFNENVIHEDAYLTPIMLSDAKRITLVEDCLYMYRLDNLDSITHRPVTKKYIENTLAIYDYYQTLISSRHPELLTYVDICICSILPEHIINQLMVKDNKKYPELYARSLSMLSICRGRAKHELSNLSKHEKRRLWFVMYMRVLIRPLLSIRLFLHSLK